MLKHSRWTCGAVLLCLLALPVAARAEVEAYTRARHQLRLGFTVPGRITDIAVKPGDRVSEGDLLIELDDKEGQIRIEMLRLQAESQVSIQAAEAQVDMAEFELARLEDIYYEKEAGKSPAEIKRAEIQLKINRLQLEQAKVEKQDITKQLEQAMAQHERYQMHAPLDGVIEEVPVSVGETVEQLTPVLAMVVIDPLRVDAAVPTEQTMTLKPGDPAWVRLSLAGHDEPIKGHIVHLGQVADAASGTRLVRVEIPNPEKLPAGLAVTLSFTAP